VATGKISTDTTHRARSSAIAELLVEEFTDYDSVVVFLAVARAYIVKFFVTSH